MATDDYESLFVNPDDKYGNYYRYDNYAYKGIVKEVRRDQLNHKWPPARYRNPIVRELYIAALADNQDCLSIQSLHSLRPCSSAASLLLKVGPRMRLISTIESRRRLVRKIVPCEYQSNLVTKLGMAEPSIRNPLYRSIPIASPPWERYFLGVKSRVQKRSRFNFDV